MKNVILIIPAFMLFMVSCAPGTVPVTNGIPADSLTTATQPALSDREMQIIVQKQMLALIEAGHPDSIMACVSREDSQSVSELARMSVLYQADTIIKDWYNHQTVSFTADDSSDPPAWTAIPDGIGFGENGFYIVGYGESSSESVGSSSALMNARMRIGRLFADSLTERLAVIDDEVREIVSLFGTMIALYGTKESERWIIRDGTRKKCYSLMILNRDDIRKNVAINIANQLKRMYRKDRGDLIRLIRKGNFQDYQTVLRSLHVKRIDQLEKKQQQGHS